MLPTVIAQGDISNYFLQYNLPLHKFLVLRFRCQKIRAKFLFTTTSVQNTWTAYFVYKLQSSLAGRISRLAQIEPSKLPLSRSSESRNGTIELLMKIYCICECYDERRISEALSPWCPVMQNLRYVLRGCLWMHLNALKLTQASKASSCYVVDFMLSLIRMPQSFKFYRDYTIKTKISTVAPYFGEK